MECRKLKVLGDAVVVARYLGHEGGTLQMKSDVIVVFRAYPGMHRKCPNGMDTSREATHHGAEIEQTLFETAKVFSRWGKAEATERPIDGISEAIAIFTIAAAGRAASRSAAGVDERLRNGGVAVATERVRSSESRGGRRAIGRWVGLVLRAMTRRLPITPPGANRGHLETIFINHRAHD